MSTKNYKILDHGVPHSLLLWTLTQDGRGFLKTTIHPFLMVAESRSFIRSQNLHIERLTDLYPAKQPHRNKKTPEDRYQ